MAAGAQVISVVRRNTLSFRILPDFCFLALSLSPGHNPAQEEMCLSVGKRSMSVAITEMIACALVLPMPVTPWIAFEACFSSGLINCQSHHPDFGYGC